VNRSHNSQNQLTYDAGTICASGKHRAAVC
jgi:hypothetical protein